ncbi:MAG TPA: lysylphosphatidylglycerol synthase transmembrane domain-containing protein [Anaerolineales bacterium]
MKSASPKKRLPSKGKLVRWAGTLVSTALFVWLIARQDWARIWDHLANTPIWLLPLVFLLYFMGQVLNSLRWANLLRAQGLKVPFVEVLKMVLTGAFASNFLPSTIGGDTVRIVSLLRFNASWGVSVASVMMDRLLNVVAMFTILPFSFLVFGDPAIFFERIRGFEAEPLLAGIGVANTRVEKYVAKVNRWFGRIWEILRAWVQHPRVLLGSFALSWSSSFIIFIAIWILARGLEMQVSLYQVMGVMALSYAVNLLPISINGYGVREIALTTLYMHIGASLEQASTLAVVTRFVLLIEALPGALWLPRAVPTVNGEEEKV